MEPRIIVLLGISGSGKGTQAKLLSEKLGLDYFGTGDLLRARKQIEDFTGKKIGEVIDAGKFVPSVLIAQLIIEGLEPFKKREAAEFKGLVIDGATRILFEAQMLDEAIEWYEWEEYLHVFLIDVSEKEATLRLLNRRMCINCRKIIPYIGEFKDFKKCDACGGELVKRPDDNAKGIKSRMEEYEKYGKPIVKYYEQSDRLVRINGEQPIGDAHRDILSALKL